MEEKKKESRPKKLIYYCLWVFIVAMFTGLIITQAGYYNQLRTELDRVEANIEEERRRRDDLSLRMQIWDSDAYIERLARERLGMVRPHEIVFRNIAE